MALSILAAVTLADWKLTVLSVLPSITGASVAMVGDANIIMASGVGAGSLLLTLLLVRSYPSIDLRSWRSWARCKLPATCAGMGLGCVVVAALGFTPRTWAFAAAGCFVAAAVQCAVVHPLLQRLFHRPWTMDQPCEPGSTRHIAEVLSRFQHLPPSIRYWARGKIRFDPLFHSLHQHLPSSGSILDIGCGFGLQCAWIAATHPELRLLALDTLPKRVRYARHVLDRKADVLLADACGRWEKQLTGPFDAVLCIDVIHHLTDPMVLLRKAAEGLRPGGVLLLRTTVRDDQGERSSHRVERLMVWLRGQRTIRFYTTAEMSKAIMEAGFCAVEVESAQPGKTETLFIAKR